MSGDSNNNKNKGNKMKTKQTVHHAVEGAVALFLTLALAPLALGQGALTPPGAPAPTMKTITQIEPRTPVSSAPCTISSPGSYYLTTNLVGTSGNNGITISSSHIVLDMEGFALTGVSGSSSGIYIGSTCTNVTVRNGSISGWGVCGVYSSGQGVLLEQLHASGNTSFGLDTASGSTVRDCTAVRNGDFGIYASGSVVSGCAASRNAIYGINAAYSTVANCQADGNTNTGIHAYYCTVENCQVQNSGYYGIWAERSTVRGCLSYNNSANGILAYWSSVFNCEVQYNAAQGIFAQYATVSDCRSINNVLSGIYVNNAGCQIIGNTSYNDNSSGNASHAGIYVNDSYNRIEANHVVAAGHAGILVADNWVGNVVIRNTVSGSGASNYVTNSTSAFGPIITASGTITNVNPWANFSY
jgi:Right handed beta helix region